MNTWLFIWNPKLYAWDGWLDSCTELKSDLEQCGIAYLKWTCGVNKSIHTGDRIFLIRLGEEPRGIVASGHAASDVFEGIHWDLSKRKSGQKARRVYIKLDKIIDHKSGQVLTYAELEKLSTQYCWSPRCSGVSIPKNVADALEQKWVEY